MSASSNPDSAAATRLAEVIETSTLGFWAESDTLHELPPLGALVRTNVGHDLATFGVVAFGQTGSIDPGRRAVRRGSADVLDEAIYRRHPELDHVLRTTFYVASVGHKSGRVVRPSLPPSPVPLHYSVYPCDRDDVRSFCGRPAYLSLLLEQGGDVPAEQVIAAHLRWVDEQMDDDHQWLRETARQLARLLRRDYAQLVTILESVDPDLS